VDYGACQRVQLLWGRDAHPRTGQPEDVAPAVAPNPQPAKKPVKSPPPVPKFVRKSYYVTPAQHKALRIMAANGETPADKDISVLVRAGIDMILAKNKNRKEP